MGRFGAYVGADAGTSPAPVTVPQTVLPPARKTPTASIARSNRKMAAEISRTGQAPATPPQWWGARAWTAASRPIGRLASGINEALIGEDLANKAHPGSAWNPAQIAQAPANFRKGVQLYNQGQPVTVSQELTAEGVPQDIRFTLPGGFRGREAYRGPIPVDIKREAIGSFLQGFENPLSYGGTFEAAGAAARAAGLSRFAKSVGAAALEVPAVRHAVSLFSTTAGVPEQLARLGERFKSGKAETLRTLQPVLNRLEGSFTGRASEREAAKARMALRLSEGGTKAESNSALNSSLGSLPRSTMVRIVSRALKVPVEDVARLPHSDLEDLSRQAFAELAQELRQQGIAKRAAAVLRQRTPKPTSSVQLPENVPLGPELQRLQEAVRQHYGPEVDVTKLTTRDLDQLARQALYEHFEPAAAEAGQQAVAKAQQALEDAYRTLKPNVDRNFVTSVLGPKKHLAREELRRMSPEEVSALVQSAVPEAARLGLPSYADVARRTAEGRGINLDRLIQNAATPAEEHAAQALHDLVLEAVSGTREVPESLHPLLAAAARGAGGIQSDIAARQALLSQIGGGFRALQQRGAGSIAKLAGGVKALAKQTIAEAPKGQPNPKLLAEARALVRKTFGATSKEVRALTQEDLADLIDSASAELKAAHPIASMSTAQRYEELARHVAGAAPEDLYRSVTNLLPAVEAGKTVEYTPRTGYFHHVYDKASPFQRAPSFLQPEAAAVRASAAGFTPRQGFTRKQVLSDLRAANQYAKAHGLKLVMDPVRSLAHRLERSAHATHAQDFLESVRSLAGTPDGQGIIARVGQAPASFQELPEVAALKGYALAPDAARYIRSLVAPRPSTSPLLQVWDSLMHGVRQGVFYLPFPHGVTNLGQNAYVAGFNELDPRNLPTMARAIQELRTEGPAYRALRRAGAYVDTFGGSSSLAHEAARSAGHVPAGERYNPLRKLHDLTWALDKFHRTALGMHLMQQGATAEEAARKVRQALGYPELTDFEKQTLSRLFLAYPWMKGNTVFQIVSRVVNPERAQAIQSLADSLNAQATGHTRAENPAGYEDAVILPVKNSKGQNLVLRHIPGPAKDLPELLHEGPVEYVGNRLAPPITYMAQEATNRQAPFNPNDTLPLNPPGETVPLFGYGQRGVGPQVTPGQQAAAAMLGAPTSVGQNANASRAQQIAQLFGVYLQPYDEQKVQRAQIVAENALLSQQLHDLRTAPAKKGSRPAPQPAALPAGQSRFAQFVAQG